MLCFDMRYVVYSHFVALPFDTKCPTAKHLCNKNALNYVEREHDSRKTTVMMLRNMISIKIPSIT